VTNVLWLEQADCHDPSLVGGKAANLSGLAAALVTDAGGSLCHAAVVAREYGLPAVVGTHTATERIRNGQIVEVDGANGVVRL
jgi:phosphoenolpyruvate synthase/pyruvate phosphate dikinase